MTYFLTSADGNGRPPLAPLDVHVYVDGEDRPICTLVLDREGLRLARYFHLPSGKKHIEDTCVIPWDKLTIQEEP